MATMAQHFLLSAAARTLSLVRVVRMSEDEALATSAPSAGTPLMAIRSAPPAAARRLRLPTRPLWKCKACTKQFSLTIGTMFHGRNLAVGDYLMAIAIFVNAAKG